MNTLSPPIARRDDARDARPETCLTPINDVQRFRQTLGHFATGLTVITCVCDGEPVGFTCQSLASVSLVPPLVSFCVKAGSHSLPKILRAGGFVANILALGQAPLSAQFAQAGTDKWRGVAWQASPEGHPVLAGCLTWLACRLHAAHPAGDHVIVLGEVLSLGPVAPEGAEPLLYFRGACHGLRQGQAAQPSQATRRAI